MDDANRCLNCGADRPADAPEGLCPRCLILNALGEDTPMPTAGVTVDGPGATVARISPVATEVGLATTPVDTRGPGTEAADSPGAALGPMATSSLSRGAIVRYFGDYEIKAELGRGGMGVVYEARQVSLNRPVAVKMVKAGLLAGDDELRRFQNEAEAVALLDHPGIVPVYEVGEQAGQHYFSMKLVPGGSLVPLLDRFKQDPKAAARLLAETAEAVAHAHMRGILHRDLKPANILVDAEGHPQVTDFGLAKRVEAEAELTVSGAILGTPAYMAPEQATGRRGSITTATDVYGLGSVLYALLTGKAPFGGNSVVETLDAVRNIAPEPPTKVNASAPRDLETICLKCLEKDPRRRYATAQAVADDLHAWLGSRPISARRVGASERAWLWCKRKPAVAALAAAVVLASVGGTAATIGVQAHANLALASKNTDLTAALGREAAANLRVEARYKLAVDAIKTFHTGVSKDFLLKEEKFKVLRDRLLKSAIEFYGKLGALLGKETDLSSRRALIAAEFEVADLTARVGRKDAAIEAHRRVLKSRETLAQVPEAAVQATADVGRSLMAVAEILQETGKTDEAVATYQKAERMLAARLGSAPAAEPVRAALAACRAGLGYLLYTTGHAANALSVLRQARSDQEALARADRAIDEIPGELALTILRIGRLLAETGKPVEAEAEYRKALALDQKLADGNPAVTQFRARLANSHNNLAWLLSQTGKPAEAEAEYRAALALYQELADDDPAVTEFRSHLANSHFSLGFQLVRNGKADEAEGEHRMALLLQRKLADDNPALPDLRSRLADSHFGLGWLLTQMGKPAEAEAEYRTALGLRQKLADDEPAVNQFRNSLAYSHNHLGVLLSQTGKPADAETEFRKALPMYQKLAVDNPAVTQFRDRLASSRTSFGILLSHRGKPAEASAEFREALALQRKLADDNPALTEFRENLANTHLSFGNLLAATGKPVEAEAQENHALAIFQKLADDNPAVPYFSNCVASALNNLGAVIRPLGRAAEARDGFERAVTIRERLVKDNPNNTAYRSLLAYSLRRRGLANSDLGEFAAAADDARRAIGLFDGLPSRSGAEWFETACSHVALSGLAGRAGAGVPASDAAIEADMAMPILSKAVGLGYRNAGLFRTEDVLDPLRGRPDFQLMLMDLAIPEDPFAR